MEGRLELVPRLGGEGSRAPSGPPPPAPRPPAAEPEKRSSFRNDNLGILGKSLKPRFVHSSSSVNAAGSQWMYLQSCIHAV